MSPNLHSPVTTDPEIAEPINIFSGERGLGGALTNPTEMAKHKGCIQKSYPVFFAGLRWPDVETAYKSLKGESREKNDELMVELIAAKFRQHTRLRDTVAAAGGVPWLSRCSHLTGARSPGAKSWEGTGLESRFIRNLVKGYEEAFQEDRTERGQGQLF